MEILLGFMLILIVLLFVGLTIHILYMKPDRKTCGDFGERTHCFNVTRTSGINRFKHKYTRITIDPIYKYVNNSIVYDMVIHCSFNPSDLLLNSIMFGSGKARPHSLKVNRKKGTMIARFYTTYRTLTFDLTPNLDSVRVDRIHLEPQSKYDNNL